MVWMAERADQRARPATLWPEVRSILVLAMSYRPETNPLALLEARERGAVAAYAQRRDYHDVMKGKLKELGGYSGWAVVEAEQDPKKANPAVYSKMGHKNLSKYLSEAGLT